MNSMHPTNDKTIDLPLRAMLSVGPVQVGPEMAKHLCLLVSEFSGGIYTYNPETQVSGHFRSQPKITRHLCLETH